MTETDSKATLLVEASSDRGNMKLPKHLYSSRFSYLIHFHRIASLIGVFHLLLFIAVTWLLSVKTVPQAVEAGSIVFFVGVPIVIIAVIAFITTSRVELPTTAKVELLKQTIIQRPALSAELWDVVAAHMNDYLCASGVTSFPLYYYDGNDCHHHFNTMFLDSNAPTPAGLLSEISDDQHNSNIENDPNRDIRSIVDEAIKVYDQSVKDYWRQQLGEASSQLPGHPGQN